MRIGELARQVGVSADTVRFYERSGWLPRPARSDNDYRDYADSDVAHLRLLIDLRRLDIPLEDAAQIAAWCHSGHCTQTAGELPGVIAERRAAIADRIAGLMALDTRLAGLARHLSTPGRALVVQGADVACCEAARAVMDANGAGCGCCSAATVLREPVLA